MIDILLIFVTMVIGYAVITAFDCIKEDYNERVTRWECARELRRKGDEKESELYSSRLDRGLAGIWARHKKRKVSNIRKSNGRETRKD